ncbi:MAG: helix-turn-helix domain-containing protein [Bifidobacteriaceae bacterium]|nr:helix-turn-helix domain-containing protein [Bifidobacteriaceae bacterium]
MVLLRNELGGVLRDARIRQRRTLRDVATLAQISLGYLSEIERGQKEASSELLAAICLALEVPLWSILREVCDRVTVYEDATMPRTVPDEFVFEDDDFVFEDDFALLDEDDFMLDDELAESGSYKLAKV